MATPKSFGGTCGVLNSGMTVIIILYAGMGFLGYLKYGADALGSVTLNLPEGEWVSQSIRVLFAIAIFISYGLQCYVPVDIIWNVYLADKYKDSGKKQLVYEMLVRIVVVITTCKYMAATSKFQNFTQSSPIQSYWPWPFRVLACSSRCLGRSACRHWESPSRPSWRFACDGPTSSDPASSSCGRISC